MKILVTGAAGFIGFHVCRYLLGRGEHVVGFDNVNNYYDVRIKHDRLAILERYDKFDFVRGSLQNQGEVEKVFDDFHPCKVVNLAAQAGVRHSLSNPHTYVDSNITGFLNILEACRHHGIAHLVYASSSSVYGGNSALPFSVHDNVDHPVSLYAVSKKANELMAHSYSHLYGIPVTGLRFFTVYGPWGRPDMALFIFTKAILENRPIDIYNNGDMVRDFTYIDDIVEGIVRVLDRPAVSNPQWDSSKPDPATSSAPYRLYNIGNNSSVRLLDFIEAIERELGMEAQKNFLPMQPGDVPATCADVDALVHDMGYKPSTTVDEGIRNFIEWYREYFQV